VVLKFLCLRIRSFDETRRDSDFDKLLAKVFSVGIHFLFTPVKLLSRRRNYGTSPDIEKVFTTSTLQSLSGFPAAGGNAAAVRCCARIRYSRISNLRAIGTPAACASSAFQEIPVICVTFPSTAYLVFLAENVKPAIFQLLIYRYVWCYASSSKSQPLARKMLKRWYQFISM
jgi:hypothetical protein